MYQLKCQNLTLGYDSRIIVSGLDFEVEKGSYLCIIGENGSGKSTLMKTILGLHKPLEGSIETGPELSSKEIGYLPQQTEVQKDFPASVREIVISGCQARMGWRPFYTKEEHLLAAKNLAKLGISHLAKRCYRELSGGQQQRVLLARALCATQKMLLLDEPVTGLDPSATEEMYELIENLNKEGITIIMISHDIDAAMKHATHILHIDSKNKPFYGTKEHFVHSKNCRDCADKIRKFYVRPVTSVL